MSNVKIEYTDNLTPEQRSVVTAGFERHEAKKGVECNYKQFSFLANNEEGIPIGLITAHTAFLDIHIVEMWVDEGYRGKGIGRKLVEQLEARFNGTKYNNINVYSSAFEAPEFYQKCGFEVEFIRKNTEQPQYTKTYLVKYL